MQSSREPIGLFDEFVAADFLRDTARCLSSSYEAAWEECRATYPWQEAHDLLGYVRRARFESEWRTLSSRYPNLRATVEPNAARNCFHTVIVAGQVFLTASKVAKPEEVVRNAIFRQTYARSRQMSFLEDESRIDPQPGAPLYAILIHAPSDTRSIPLFAHIVFPSPDCQSYVARIRLEHRFPEYFGAPEDSNVENVQDAAFGELRDDIAKRNRKNA